MTVKGDSQLNTLTTSSNTSVGGTLSVTKTITTYAPISQDSYDETVPTTKWTTDAIDSAITASSSIPVGGIIMWSTSDIPKNWALCDGKTYEGIKTPDLIDLFIVGAGNLYTLDKNGGESTVTLTIDEIPSHNHEITDNGHSHTIPATKIDKTGQDSGQSNYLQPVDNTTIASGDDITNITINNSGGGLPHNNLPPYYALYYIMRIK